MRKTDNKTHFVASKFPADLKEKMERYAAERDWTLSQVIRNCVTRVIAEDGTSERAA
jgi:hypothetical protein